MSVTIWEGSSSFSSGQTPYGFYDSDNEFTSSADQFVSENSVIPGLPIAKNQQGQSNVISQSDSIGDLADPDVDQSPLGELRFKD